MKNEDGVKKEEIKMGRSGIQEIRKVEEGEGRKKEIEKLEVRKERRN